MVNKSGIFFFHTNLKKADPPWIKQTKRVTRSGSLLHQPDKVSEGASVAC